MNRYKLFATRLGLRAISAIFSFMRVLIIFSFGVSAIATMVVDRVHLMTELEMNQLFQKNETIIITCLIFALGVDMLLQWFRDKAILFGPLIVDLLRSFFPQKQEINLHETQP